MLPLFWLLLVLLAVSAVVVMPVLLGWEFFKQYRGVRAVSCPENHQRVAVSFNALRAAATQLAGRPRLEIAECTRWPERADCGQECLHDAQQTPEYTKGEIAPSKHKAIYHLPVLIAAIAAWVLGAIWHSHYLLRAQWMDAVGLSRSEVHQLVWTLTPHLLSFAVLLLFAYWVAWVLAWRKEKGPWRGALIAIALWAAIAATGLAVSGLQGLSGDLLKIELSYTVLASLVVGLVVGGLSGRLMEKTFAN
jgi:uncharacterized protein DUF1761